MHTLEIKHLNVKIEKKEVLKDFSLIIKSGEIHAIMGPNGVGKSTLSKVIMGSPDYKIVSGEILFDGENINELTPDKRSNLGIFLGMQMPLEIEGVTNADFLRTASHIKKGNDFHLFEFIKELESDIKDLNMDSNMIHRGLNVGFSGGERKKNEILQMFILKPNTVLLDEIDSGLDVDSLKIIGQNVMKYYKENRPSILLITHYQRLLDYIKPDFVHIMMDGKIVKTGDFSLVKEIEKNGYDSISIMKETSTHE